MNFLFLMDPLQTVIMEKDTSFLIMIGAHRRGHKVFFLPDGGITRVKGQLHFHVIDVTPQLIKEKPFIENKTTVLSQDDVDVIFIRSDPPFDQQYLINTWLLDLLPKHIPVINQPSGVRTANEKIWATQFEELIPPTLVGRNRKDLLSFLAEHGNVVAKPTDGFGGQSVFHLKQGETNVHVILETMTQDYNNEIVMQQYIEDSEKGDKRILLLDGEPLGAVLRMHAEDDHRNNFFSGGIPLDADINERDQEIIETIQPKLKELGLYFVGIDIIGSYLIEINVTSPTCLQEINRLKNLQLEDRIIDFAEKCVDQFKSNSKILA